MFSLLSMLAAFVSPLTGVEVASEAETTAPVYCIQTPNGTDGARPQAGMHEAGVIFEAIAEAGITRFAALYQAPKTGVIGPIRSLRMYYLEWDTPFDCTIIHAGGAADALAEVSRGYKHLSQNYTYMWRGSSSNNVLVRRWNNLFTSGEYLANLARDTGYTSSNVKSFTRMSAEESLKSRVDNLITNRLDIDTETSESTKTLAPKVTSISLRFGRMPNFNPNYNYDIETNSYYRSYESGMLHLAYDCAEGIGEVTPELSCGEATQLHPSVVIAMIVQEKKAADGAHESITTIGSGKAYIFQNGDVVEGTWEKASRDAQIRFMDADGKEVALAPGQTFISAIPNYGSASYE